MRTIVFHNANDSAAECRKFIRNAITYRNQEIEPIIVSFWSDMKIIKAKHQFT